MKTLKIIVCWILIIVTLGTLCACGGAKEKEESVEDKVRSAVRTRGMVEYIGSSIGGNELKSSSATITNLKKISDTEYRVSGKIVMTDIYGTKWNNTFDCNVYLRTDGESWSASSFEFTSKSWTKG